MARSIGMIAGAVAISTALASAQEQHSKSAAIDRECARYGLARDELLAAQEGEKLGAPSERRRWWDIAIVVAALGVFAWLASHARVPRLAMDVRWMALLALFLLSSAVVVGRRLWKQTRFS